MKIKSWRTQRRKRQGFSVGVEAELEKKKAVDEVKREMVVLASMMAAKVVNAAIDTTVQDSLVEETLKEIGESTWLS